MSVRSTIIVDTNRAELLMTSAAARVGPAVTRAVHEGGALLRTVVRAKASGRPGPRVQTGDYRRGISLQTGHLVGHLGTPVPYATVFSTSPQGRRLEHGFIGVDSLGRHYHQPAFPHFAPAARETEPVVQAKVERAVDELLRTVA